MIIEIGNVDLLEKPARLAPLQLTILPLLNGGRLGTPPKSKKR
jgi:hypothetical protein